MVAEQNLNQVTPTVIQAVGQLSDLIEQRLAAAENHIPAAIWVVFIPISSLTSLAVGYTMRRRIWLGMLVYRLRSRSYSRWSLNWIILAQDWFG